MGKSTRSNIIRNLLRLFFRLTLLAVIGIATIFTIKTIRFASKQVKIESIEKIKIGNAPIQRFAKAVQIPTISSTSRVDTTAFENLDSFIQKNYPLMDSLLEKETVNRFSYIYKWQGKNPKLNPILLLAHLDVVPVEEGSLEKWTHLPFSGKIVDGAIWGRGSMDDKSSAFEIMEAVTMLLAVDYLPERTVYLAFGHDEEVSGLNGAQAIVEKFKQRKLEFEFILDEGSLIVENAVAGLANPLALIGIAEKGYTTLTLTANLEDGGHSSMPPAETAVGVLSKAIYTLQENPFPAKIDGAVRDMFDHIGPEMGAFNKTLFANLWLTEKLILKQFSQSPQSNAMIRTTTAPTMLRGGVKDNVLPTKASARINFRIIPGETVESVADYVRQTINDNRVIVMSGDAKLSQNPSVVSSTESFGFQIIQTTIQQLNPDVVVAPSLVIAATDSRHYTELSDHIYRFQPIQIEKTETKRFHGINERLEIENYKQGIRFYRELILNAGR
ncbi:MAG: carboxypeptidase PM20D1 [Paraglaciecola sp.]|jgi:carboxypeptidase PM20D1